MSYEAWVEYLEKAEKKSLMSERTRKVSYNFHDGQRMVEEYCLETGVVQKRMWQKKRQLMSEIEWEVELGEDYRQIGEAAKSRPTIGDGDNNFINNTEFVIRASTSEPIISKRITKRNIEWRIRNMPYPLDVYVIEIDKDKKSIIIKTTNRKYYKVLRVHELERCNIDADIKCITKQHQFNTLIISYKKPTIVNEMEAQVLLMLKNVETETDMSAIMARFM